jgi:hypothetical protein
MITKSWKFKTINNHKALFIYNRLPFGILIASLGESKNEVISGLLSTFMT